jgi:hypothetical protein
VSTANDVVHTRVDMSTASRYDTNKHTRVDMSTASRYDTNKQTNKYEDMDEEHSDEYMDDTDRYNTRTWMRNIVTSTWTIQTDTIRGHG